MIEHGAAVELKNVVNFFIDEQLFNAGGAVRAGGLHVFPEGIKFFALSGDLRFGHIRRVEAVGFGFFRAEGVAGGRFFGRGM